MKKLYLFLLLLLNEFFKRRTKKKSLSRSFVFFDTNLFYLDFLISYPLVSSSREYNYEILLDFKKNKIILSKLSDYQLWNLKFIHMAFFLYIVASASQILNWGYKLTYLSRYDFYISYMNHSKWIKKNFS